MKNNWLTITLILLSFTKIHGEQAIFPNGKFGVVLPSSEKLEMQDGVYGIDVSGGFLYQRLDFASQSAGYSYSPSFSMNTDFDVSVTRVGKDLVQNLPFSFGATVGMAKGFAHDHICVSGRFDWVSAHTGSVIDVEGVPNLELRINQAASSQAVVGSSFTWSTDTVNKIEYYSSMDSYFIDIHLSRGSNISELFSYEPYAAILAIWFNTMQKTNNYSTSFDTGNYLIFKENQNNWGAGIGFGLDTLFELPMNIGLFLDLELGFLLGNAYRVDETTLVGGSGAEIASNQSVYTKTVIDAQLYFPVRALLGIQYGRLIRNERNFLCIKAGYDVRQIVAYPNVHTGFGLSGLYTNLEWSF